MKIHEIGKQTGKLVLCAGVLMCMLYGCSNNDLRTHGLRSDLRGCPADKQLICHGQSATRFRNPGRNLDCSCSSLDDHAH